MFVVAQRQVTVLGSGACVHCAVSSTIVWAMVRAVLAQQGLAFVDIWRHLGSDISRSSPGLLSAVSVGATPQFLGKWKS